MRGERQLARPPKPRLEAEPHPIGIETPRLRFPRRRNPRDRECIIRQIDDLVELERAEIELERYVDKSDVEPHEADHRPRADKVEQQPGGEADGPDRRHQHREALGPEGAVRREHGVEMRWAFARRDLWRGVCVCHSKERASPLASARQGPWRNERKPASRGQRPSARRDRGSAPRRSRRFSAASPSSTRTRRPSFTIAIPSPCSWPWSCRRKRPTPRSTAPRPTCSQSPPRRINLPRSARPRSKTRSRPSASIAVRPRTLLHSQRSSSPIMAARYPTRARR